MYRNRPLPGATQPAAENSLESSDSSAALSIERRQAKRGLIGCDTLNDALIFPPSGLSLPLDCNKMSE